jgi:hypothetical protein
MYIYIYKILDLLILINQLVIKHGRRWNEHEMKDPFTPLIVESFWNKTYILHGCFALQSPNTRREMQKFNHSICDYM